MPTLLIDIYGMAPITSHIIKAIPLCHFAKLIVCPLSHSLLVLGGHQMCNPSEVLTNRNRAVVNPFYILNLPF